ncbi:MEDS domain-containing protein [Salinibacter sp. 10B]|uniref:MEDS domain-containing protein n=1 Tax=Salinibacter sp. 10B TaxID=1923971 RepID=UPI0015E3E58B|nr:MEDS domain-containing protein [Salinibacter sp. 10B]
MPPSPSSSSRPARSASVPLGIGDVTASVGDHIAHFFRGEEERFSVLDPYLQTGLQRGDRCVCVARPGTGEALCDWLTERDVDIETARQTDRLVLHPGRDTEEDMEAMVHRIDQSARDENEPVVRWAGDGEWVLDRELSVHEMLRWEALYDRTAADLRMLALCQFNLSAFHSDVMMDALRTHPYCVMGEVVVPNPFHESPEAVRKDLSETDRTVDP